MAAAPLLDQRGIKEVLRKYQAGEVRQGCEALSVREGAPPDRIGTRSVRDQIWPAFSSAVQQVSTSSRVTT